MQCIRQRITSIAIVTFGKLRECKVNLIIFRMYVNTLVSIRKLFFHGDDIIK